MRRSQPDGQFNHGARGRSRSGTDGRSRPSPDRYPPSFLPRRRVVGGWDLAAEQPQHEPRSYVVENGDRDPPTVDRRSVTLGLGPTWLAQIHQSCSTRRGNMIVFLVVCAKQLNLFQMS